MIIRFVDTHYLLALVNPQDQAHEAARRWVAAPTHGLVTTPWVLVEFADALAGVSSRQQAARFIRGLLQEPGVEIVPATSSLFEAGLLLYEQRKDKDWSLTDCLSFAVM